MKKKMYGIIVFAIFFTMKCIASDVQSSTQTADSAYKIFLDGSPLRTIAIPESPSKDVLTAANDLSRYLTKICDEKLPVKKGFDKNTKGAFILCPFDDLKTFGLKYEKSDLGEDGYIIKSLGDKIIFSGPSPISLRFAVYGFLEDILGIRWFNPWSDGEDIIRHDKINLTALDIIQKPSFGHRWPMFGNTAWLIKNRCNPFSFPSWGGHSYEDLVPLDKYFDKHPEYYALVDGKRKKQHGHPQICTTNPEVIRIASDKIMRIAAEHPEIKCFKISPEDNPYFCECENCRALDSGETTTVWRKKVPVITDRIVLFANEVIKRVKEKYPDKYFAIYAYHNYTTPPQNVKPDKRLFIWLCHHTPACYSHTVFDENCTANRTFIKCLKGWSKQTDNIIVYSYIFKSAADHLLWPVETIHAANLKYFAEHGVKGIYGQGRMQNFGLLGLPYWVVAKLLWNVKLGENTLLEDYYHRYYREAYKPMKQYHEYLRKRMLDCKVHLTGKSSEEGPAFLTPAVMVKLKGFLLEAMNAAQSKVTKKRIKRIWTVFRYNELYLAANRGKLSSDQLIATKQAYKNIKDFLQQHKNDNALAIGPNGELSGSRLTRKMKKVLSMKDPASFHSVAKLPAKWYFRLDPNDEGVKQEWWKKQQNYKGWQKIETGKSWEEQGFEYNGYAWYKIDFKLDTSEKNKYDKYSIYFSGVDGHAWVYLNGIKVGENHEWDKGFSVDITKAVSLDGENTLAVRVYDGAGVGGIYGMVICYGKKGKNKQKIKDAPKTN